MEAVKSELVLQALEAQIRAYFESGAWIHGDVIIERNEDTPVDYDGSPIIIIRDGEPGEADQACGQFGPCIYTHTIDIELYVHSADRVTRDQRWARLLRGIDTALSADKTLGGQVFGMQYSNPAANSSLVEGAENVKSGTLSLVTDYQTVGRIG